MPNAGGGRAQQTRGGRTAKGNARGGRGRKGQERLPEERDIQQEESSLEEDNVEGDEDAQLSEGGDPADSDIAEPNTPKGQMQPAGGPLDPDAILIGILGAAPSPAPDVRLSDQMVITHEEAVCRVLLPDVPLEMTMENKTPEGIRWCPISHPGCKLERMVTLGYVSEDIPEMVLEYHIDKHCSSVVWPGKDVPQAVCIGHPKSPPRASGLLTREISEVRIHCLVRRFKESLLKPAKLLLVTSSLRADLQKEFDELYRPMVQIELARPGHLVSYHVLFVSFVLCCTRSIANDECYDCRWGKKMRTCRTGGVLLKQYGGYQIGRKRFWESWGRGCKADLHHATYSSFAGTIRYQPHDRFTRTSRQSGLRGCIWISG